MDAPFSSSRRRFLAGATSAAGALGLSPTWCGWASASWRADSVTAHPPQRLDNGWQYRRGALDGIWEVWRSEEAELWNPVVLPHSFNSYDACDPDVPYYRGHGWYRTKLDVANPFPGGRTMLHFQGAGQTSTLWVGSTLVGTHKGGYDEFAFDISDAVAGMAGPGKSSQSVPVAVRCDNGPDLERVPSDLSDFCLFGGLYRHVNLIYLPAVALDAVHVLPSAGANGPAQVVIKARIYNPTGYAGACQLTVEVFDPKGTSIHRVVTSAAAWEGLAEVSALKVPSPDRWSPENPALYRCQMELSTPSGVSVLEERFGIRHTEFVEHGPFLLNGKRFFLRGTHRHADGAGTAAAQTDEQVRTEMRLIRDMGANFIRLAHYQQDRLVLELCDELGLMVWEEAPWCREGDGGAGFRENAKAMLTHMIDQHVNHPSIILWGLGNEDDWPNEYPSIDKPAIRAFMTEMRDLAHTLDSSRLTSFRRCDFARDIPDVYSPSIWAGWYKGNYREYEAALTTERERVKRFIHIEWGADSQAGRHSEDPEVILRKVQTGKGTAEEGLAYLKTGGDIRVSTDGDWSETYACNLFDWYLKTQEKLDWLTGAAQWVFKDFASPLRSDDGVPNVNQKGVVQRDLTLKESYFVFQSYWATKPMVHLYGHTWPIRWGKAGEARSVKVYSNCKQAELFLNGKSQGICQRDSQNFPAAGLRWDVVFTPGANHLRAVAKSGSVTLSDEIDVIYQTEPWAAPAELRMAEVKGSGKDTTVVATLCDAHGVQCLDSRKQVRFSIAGPGKLIDNLGTVHGSRVVQLANGRAQISASLHEAGYVIGVETDGVPPAFLTVAPSGGQHGS